MNHVMSDLREAQREETRNRIVQAALGLLASQDPAAISMPAVAEASGVSLRTVYRYFPNKPELLEAAGVWFDGREWAAAVGRDGPQQLTPNDFGTYQRVRFADFDNNRAAVLAQLSTPGGRELRRQRLGEQRAVVRSLVGALVPDLAEADLHRLADAALATASSASFAELVDRMGLEAADAADLTAWMIEAFLAHATATGTTRPQGSDDEGTSR